MPEAARTMVASLPPGFSDAESATVSRERRRVALAARIAVQELDHPLGTQLDEVKFRLTKILALH